MLNFGGAAGAIATAGAFSSADDEITARMSNAALNYKNDSKGQMDDLKLPKIQSNLIECERCGKLLELYSEETLGHLILICSSIIQRECALVAPYVLDIILSVTRHVD
jgi:hypothetical protein